MTLEGVRLTLRRGVDIFLIYNREDGRSRKRT